MPELGPLTVVGLRTEHKVWTVPTNCNRFCLRTRSETGRSERAELSPVLGVRGGEHAELSPIWDPERVRLSGSGASRRADGFKRFDSSRVWKKKICNGNRALAQARG